MVNKNLSVNEIRDGAKPVLEKHNVVKAEVFGSYARNEEDKESDIDILVELEDGKTLADMAELKKDLERKLGQDVDIVTYSSIDPEIREKIFAEAIKI